MGNCRTCRSDEKIESEMKLITERDTDKKEEFIFKSKNINTFPSQNYLFSRSQCIRIGG